MILAGTAGVTHAAPPAGYYLVWSDEFNAAAMDRGTWGPDWGARRDAINTSKSISCNGSNLVITTYTREGAHYTGLLDSRDRFVFKYGYAESSINFDDSPGMWSAYWMISPTMGSYLGDPGYAGIEIDVCEHRKVDGSNLNIDGVVVANLHWDGYGTAHKSIGSGNIGSGLGTGFHTYAVKWTETNYSFLIDGAQKWSTTNALSHRSEYILLSSEVLSNSWAGQVPAAGYGDLPASSTRLIVDYVRYYAPTTTVFWAAANSGAWGDAGNWLAGMLPKPNDDIVFSLLATGTRTTTLDRDYAVRSLSLLESHGSVIIQSNAITVGSGGIDLTSARYNLLLRSAVVLGATQRWVVSANHLLHAYGSVSGAGGLRVDGYGKVILNSSNAFTGDTRVLRGTLSLRHPDALQSSTLDMNAADSGVVNIETPGGCVLGGLKGARALAFGAGGLTFGRNNASNTYSGNLTGLGGLTKTGQGLQKLSGTNAYGGPTFVSAGILQVANTNSSATGTGSVFVASGATLAGAGIITGKINLNGAIAPGDGIGTLTTGSQTWNPGGSYIWQISNPTNSTGWDQLMVNGDITLAADATPRFELCSLVPGGQSGPLAGFNNKSNYTWTVATTSEGITNFAWNRIAVDSTRFANDLAGGAFTVEQAGSSLVVKFHPNTGPSQFTTARLDTVGDLVLDATGIPGRTYSLQFTTNLALPVLWLPVADLAADPEGKLRFIEPTGDGSKFYRLLAP